jgi:hypothetical protein
MILKTCSLAVVALASLQSLALADLCMPPPVQAASPYHYLNAFAEALGCAKHAVDRVDSAGVGQSDNDAALALFLALKRGKSDYECAAALMSPYRASTSKAIAESAEGATAAFASLAKLQAESIERLKTMLNSGPDGENPGSELEGQAEAMESRDKALNLLLMSAIGATFTVIEEDRQTGRMSRLALTRAQRDELLRELRSAFGDEIIGGLKEGQFRLTAAAATIYEVIGNPGYKLRASPLPERLSNR